MRQRARMLEDAFRSRPLARGRECSECSEWDTLRASHARLAAAKAELEASHTNLLSLVEHIRIGIIIVDAQQHVLFASKTVGRLTGTAEGGLVGQPLSQVLPVEAETLALIQGLIDAPASCPRVTVELRPAAGPRYCADVEVRPDSRDETHRIVYLYDVTETYELKRALDTAPEATVARLMGRSAAIRLVHSQIRTLAGVDATVLIEGETGTGKELVARAMHGLSPRKDRPFIAFNCAGLTESMLASQLFGHRRGAFTGAVTDHVGLFEAAQGGTLLLDEIGDMPMSVQTHLLRVLQEREILRLGDSKPRPINVRVLAATHRSLDQEVVDGRFRADLLYRIRVARIPVPPLRQRLDDIPLLATAFMQQFGAAHCKSLTGIGREAMDRLIAQRWPGNVRELRAAIEWAVIRATAPTIRLADLPPDVAHAEAPLSRARAADAERRQIVDTLARTSGNRAVAARVLGISRATLYRRLARLDVALSKDAEPSTE